MGDTVLTEFRIFTYAAFSPVLDDGLYTRFQPSSGTVQITHSFDLHDQPKFFDIEIASQPFLETSDTHVYMVDHFCPFGIGIPPGCQTTSNFVTDRQCVP